MGESLQEKIKDTIDNIGGAGTSDRAAGSVREGVGQAQQAIGEATGDEKLQAQGSTEELKGKAQQVSGAVQGKAQEIGEHIHATVATKTEEAKVAAGNVLDRVKDALDGDKTPHTTTPA